MKNLIPKYLKLDREIRFLEYFAIFLLTLLVVYTIWSIFNKGIENSIGAIEQLGILVSVLIVSKMSLRQLVHTDITQEDIRRMNIVRVTHHLMTIIDDLKNKVSYIEGVFEPVNSPTIPIGIIINFTEDIKNDYEVLKQSDLHEFLHGDSINLIWKMSIGISTLRIFADTLKDSQIKSVQLPTIFISNSPVKKSAVDLLSYLEQFDTQIRDLRKSIDLPDELMKKAMRINR